MTRMVRACSRLRTSPASAASEVSGMTRSCGLSSGAKAVPRQQLEHAGAYAIRAARVPVVVKAQDGHVVALQEGPLGGVDGVRGKRGGGVLVIIEGRLVGDDEVTACLGGALQHVEGGHHGGGDALHGRIGGTGLEGVDGRCPPGHAEVFLYALDHLADGERSFRRQQSGAGGEEESASGRHVQSYPARRLQEQRGGLLIARLADALAVAFRGGDVPLSGVDRGQHGGEVQQAADAEVEAHIEERFLDRLGIRVPVRQGGSKLSFETGEIGLDERSRYRNPPCGTG